MEGIKFDEKLGLLKLVLSGKKTMFRVPSRKNKVLTKYQVGQELAILQAYKDINVDPKELVFEEDENGEIVGVRAIDSKGWTRKGSVDPELMPHRIIITSVKKEYVRDISDDDCEKEGIRLISDDIAHLDGNIGFDGYSIDGRTWIGETPQDAFAAISNRAVKKDAWAGNIMVDVYEFRLK